MLALPVVSDGSPPPRPHIRSRGWSALDFRGTAQRCHGPLPLLSHSPSLGHIASPGREGDWETVCHAPATHSATRRTDGGDSWLWPPQVA